MPVSHSPVAGFPLTLPRTTCPRHGSSPCNRLPNGQGRCCACLDLKPPGFPREMRLREYCDACRAVWSATPPQDLPEEWGLGPCEHSRRSLFCLNSGPDKRQCCACHDTRTAAIPRLSRIQVYCPICAEYWKARADHECPEGWGLAVRCLKHSQIECQVAARGDTRCCLCRDDRQIPMTMQQRLGSYCQQCNLYWRCGNQERSAVQVMLKFGDREFPMQWDGQPGPSAGGPTSASATGVGEPRFKPYPRASARSNTHPPSVPQIIELPSA